MVLGIRDRIKTQTRRLVRPQPWYGSQVPGGPHYIWPPGSGRRFDGYDIGPQLAPFCPYGGAGDRLWLREAWRTGVSLDKLNGTEIAQKALDADYPKPWAPIQYEADGVRDNWIEDVFGAPGRLRIARFMPRWASRIVLEIEEVRAERLHEISEEDAKAEGVRIPVSTENCPPGQGKPLVDLCSPYLSSPGIKVPLSDGTADLNVFLFRIQYAVLWEEINGPGSWSENPWVWVIRFRRLT
jgi:hypothetical protein